MSKPRRLESPSWWRILPAMFWGGVLSAHYVPGINSPPEGPGYYLLIFGVADGAASYLILRFTGATRYLGAMMASGLRLGFVNGSLAYAFLRRDDLWYAIGASVGGFVIGLLFYGLERFTAKLIPHRFGGDPSSA